ncbi:UDP-3-O-[3-hydroxymyristoyl] N-acetylglucosamine deacetylase, partial [bacterium]
MLKRTLKKEVVLEGKGIHTGEHSRVIIAPSAHETEFRVKNRRIPARKECIRETRYRVVVAEIWTVEHLLGVLFFLQIDCCEVWIEKGREIPGIEGGG